MLSGGGVGEIASLIGLSKSAATLGSGELDGVDGDVESLGCVCKRVIAILCNMSSSADLSACNVRHAFVTDL